MRSFLLGDGLYDIKRDLNVSSDPRVGSARDNGTSTSPLRDPTQGTNSASFSTLFMTFVPILIYAVICAAIFLFLRRRFARVYAPRTFLSSLEPHDRSPKLPSGWFNWIKAFYKIPDAYVLNHASLDGFLFLRYLKILCIICGVGCIITWPILMPIHVYGGGGKAQLDVLAFGNVSHPSWYLAHAVLAWVYFGFILYLVSRECVYFINLRQAYLLSPYYANRLSSRTVLFTCVPQQMLDERKLRKVFGDAVKNVWIPRESEDLDQLVKERDQTANRLEKAEIVLIKKANEQWRKAFKNGHPDIEESSASPSFEKSKALHASVVDESPTSPQFHGSDYKPGVMATHPFGVQPEETTKSVVINVSSISPSLVHSKEADDSVISESPTSPRQFPRSDGTPGIKTSYGHDGPPPDVNGSVAAQWIPHSWRPVHRPLANYGRRADTIKWTRTRLKELAPQISKLRRRHKKGEGRPIPAAFLEFDSQVNAQSAYQTLAHHRASHMVPDNVGVRPQEIVWQSLRMHWWERIIRKFMIQAFIAVMVIFWSVPAAIIGIISNVKFLAAKFTFLHWIDLLPSEVLGLISGLLPAVALSLLMSIVPFVMRACARQSGVTTLSKIELFTQSSYFVFQVVQVFLVTTLTSAASAALTSIIENPASARTVLSANLPAASNFYVSYFILQGLAMSATRIVHLGGLVRHQLMPNSGGNPRLISRRYHRLRVIHWGAVYPVFTNMVVIAISYSLIAPIVLGFAFIGLALIHGVYRYNILYVYSSELDTRGLHYPRALKQTLTGVYLAEICLVGLFGLRAAFIPVVLMFGLIIFTFLVHVSLNDALSPLLFTLPRTLAVEEELRADGHDGLNFQHGKEEVPDVENPEHAGQDNGYDSDFDPSAPNADEPTHDPTPNTRAIEGADRALNLTTSTLTSYVKVKIKKSPLPSIVSYLDFWSYWITPDPTNPKPNFLLKFLHPEIFDDYGVLRQQVPEEWRNGEVEIVYEEGAVKDAYFPPSVRGKAPKLCIPRDPAGVSRQEVAHSGKVIGISDEGVWLDQKGMLVVDVEVDRRESWEKMRY